MAKKLLPFINRYSGEVQIMTKSQGRRLSEDWHRPKITKNQEGVQVFRFQIASPVTGKDGKVHQGIATVDISEVEVNDGDRSPA